VNAALGIPNHQEVRELSKTINACLIESYFVWNLYVIMILYFWFKSKILWKSGYVKRQK